MVVVVVVVVVDDLVSGRAFSIEKHAVQIPEVCICEAVLP